VTRDDNAGLGTHRYRVRAVNEVGHSSWTPYTVVTLVSAASGWTTFTPSPDTRTVYVSSSTGNDSNTGLSQSSPKRTINAGKALVRNGFPDWLLLKRGDTFTDESFGVWSKSGRSESERMLIGTYGSAAARPLIRTGSGAGFQWNASGGRLDNVAIVGLHLIPHTYTGSSSYPAGIAFIGPGSNFLVEDCIIEKYTMNIVIQAWQGRPENAKVRRCVIVDSFVVGSSPHTEGMYLDGIDGITVEECVIDHNGWREEVPGAIQTVFRHNVYIQSNCTDSVFRRNIVTNGAATGVQPRAGGLVEDNVLVRNPVNIQYGPADEPTPGGVSGAIRGNAILESNTLAGDGRGWGIIISNINSTGVVVENNIIANDQNPISNQQGIGIWPTQGVGVQKATIRNNVIYKWKAGLEIRQPGGGMSLTGLSIVNNVIQEPSSASEWLIDYGPASVSAGNMLLSGNKYFSGRAAGNWFGIGFTPRSHPQWVSATGETGSQAGAITIPDPNRGLGTYHASLGRTGTLQGFLAEARRQGRTFWRTEYTTGPVLQYLRQGFMGAP
jgi:hypothetical protein